MGKWTELGGGRMLINGLRAYQPFVVTSIQFKSSKYVQSVIGNLFSEDCLFQLMSNMILLDNFLLFQYPLLPTP